MKTVKLFIRVRMEIHAALIMLFNRNVDYINEFHTLRGYILKAYDHKNRYIKSYTFKL